MEPSNQRCELCPAPLNANNKSIPTHKYGDYIILRPSEKSCEKLKELGIIYNKILVNEIPGIEKHIQLTSPNDFHLSLATPLKAMKRVDVNDLLIELKTINYDSVKIFDIIFRDPKNEGSYGCVFGSPNYSPSFDIRLTSPSKNYNGHNSIESYKGLNQIGTIIQSYCRDKNLVDKSRNENGCCNEFKAHISLGKIKDEKCCKFLHERNNHFNKAFSKPLSYLVSTDANKTFQCNSNHKHCPTISIEFDKIEILRCDSEKGGSHKTTCLASLDLKTGFAKTIDQFPGCEHK